MKRKVDFEAADEAARKAALSSDKSKYGGFADIGEGGVLTLDGKNGGSVLRLEGDSAEKKPVDVSVYTRNFDSLDSSCLRCDDDGGVRIRQTGTVGSVEL